MKSKNLIKSVAASVALAVAAIAQAAYPDKVITLIAPYSAGGDSDLAARNFAAAAQKALGSPVIVVNKVGASGVIGSAQVLQAAPDGYTLLLARPGSQAILPAIMPARTKYKWEDFSMVGLLELNAYGCMTKATSYKTFKEFTDALKQEGRRMNFGTAGVLTANDMGPRQLFKMLKLDASNTPTQIPFKGTGEATASLMAGETQFACGSIGSFLPMIKNGDLRALMVTTPERMPSLPEVPTARELGYAEMERITGWSGIYGPPGLPADVVQKLSAALKEVAKDPAWLRATELTGSMPFIKGPEETKQFVKGQYEIYRSLGESLNIIDKEP